MLDPTGQQSMLEGLLFEATGLTHSLKNTELLNGGCINNVVRATTDKGQYCIKLNEAAQADMFEKEAAGLALLQATNAVAVPHVFGYGISSHNGTAWLVMDYLFPKLPDNDYWENAGRSLAAQHHHTQSTFGLHFNNYIGSLPQSNEQQENGIDFYIEKRLQVQAGLAYYNKLIDSKQLDRFYKLYRLLPDLIPDEKPALLHGDLWSGNMINGPDGQAAWIDPAVYYGLREAEIAFTQLFGGFEPAFYEAYQTCFPLQEGFDSRVDIYNIYPLMVHVNLFGKGYLSGVLRTLDRYTI